MQTRGAAAFTADLETVRAFGVSGLGGCVEASSMSVQATGAPKLYHFLIDGFFRGASSPRPLSFKFSCGRLFQHCE